MTHLVERFTKTLSATDVGESNTHQGGLLVPKDDAVKLRLFPDLDPNMVNPEDVVLVRSGTDSTEHELRFIHYNTGLHPAVHGTRDEYRLLRINELFKSLGDLTVGDTFTLELDTDGTLTAFSRRPGRAWLLIASGDDRQYAGNDGYDDQPDSFYSWDSTVPNARSVSVGDRVALWDKNQLLGFSVIESIAVSNGSKLLRHCPVCRKASIKRRSGRTPRYRCQKCGHEFDDPGTELREITVYRSRHDAAWVDALGLLSGDELRAIALSPNSQHSIREMDWSKFSDALNSEGMSTQAADVDRRARSAHGGTRMVMSKARTGQGRFRSELLGKYGQCCAISGPAPSRALDAAHLYSFADVGSHLEHGGLLLRKDLHALFDSGDITIQPDTLRLDVGSNTRQFPLYGNLDGAILKIEPTSQQRQWIALHWAQHRRD